MATSFIWICHAATAGMRAGIFPADEPIDGKATAEMTALAASLPKADRAWTSPALRSTQTADALGLNGIIEPALRDCDYGRWAGRSLAQILEHDEKGLKTWLSEPSSAPHGGEALTAVMDRVAHWIEAHRHDRGHTIVVTHPAVIRAAVIHAIGATPAAFTRIDIAPLSRTIFSVHDGQWRLVLGYPPAHE
jgi:broad specificity phosphatase PhoE